MANSCNALNVRPIKISELANYASLKTNDIILITEKNGSNLYSRKTTFGDFVSSITQLTSSLSGNVNGKFTGSMSGALKGILTGSVYGGTLRGTFIGQGSVTGIPFTTLNGQSISFKGTGSYSVSSSYSLTSTNSKIGISSSYSLTSSYGKTNFAVNAKSSSLSLTSSLAQLSKLSLSSLQSDRCNIANVSNYAYDGLYVLSSSVSSHSDFNVSSSYSVTSSYAKSGSHSKLSVTSSYALKSENTNIVKGFLSFTGYDSGEFINYLNTNLGFDAIAGFNIKSIKYVGRKRIYGTTDDDAENGRWWPTFHVEFIEPVKFANYIVQGTIWEVDWFNTGDEQAGTDNEIGTFQIPPYNYGGKDNYGRTTTGFTMSWQGGLKCENQKWCASFEVIGGDTPWRLAGEECP